MSHPPPEPQEFTPSEEDLQEIADTALRGPEAMRNLYKNIWHQVADRKRRKALTMLPVKQARQDEIRWTHIMDPNNAGNVPIDHRVPDLGIWKTEMHMHPRSFIDCGPDLTRLRDEMGKIPADHPKREKLEQVAAYMTSANSLKQLTRFLAKGYPPLHVFPDNAGMEEIDYQTPELSQSMAKALWLLQADFYLRRMLIRFLHYPGMIQWDEETGMRFDLELPRTFVYMYTAGRLLLEGEFDRVHRWHFSIDQYLAPSLQQQPNSGKLDFIRDARGLVHTVLHEIAKIPFDVDLPADATLSSTFFGSRTVPEHASRDARFEFNLQHAPGNMADRMIAMYEELMIPHPVSRLMIDLLDKEDTFERRLAVEHVEDRLINKQVTVLDDEIMIKDERNEWGVIDYKNFADIAVVKQVESYLYNILPAISLLNRQRRNFRLCRDWTKGRPWAKIFQLYDTSQRETAWLGPAIEQFLLHIKTAQVVDPEQLAQSTADSFHNIAPHLFGITPVNYSRVPLARTDPQGVCAICEVAYHGSSTPASLVASLHCSESHCFHLVCILNYWDGFGKYRYDCPSCGEAPELNAKRLGLLQHLRDRNDDFVFNNYGYREHDSPHTDSYPDGLDVTDEYLAEENQHAAVIEDTPLKWKAILQMGGGERSSVTVPWEPRNPAIKEVADRWVTGHPHRMKQAYQKAKRLARARGQSGRHPLWSVTASRFENRQERAWLRRYRIRRDRARRDVAKQRGLRGLFKR